MDQRTVDLDGPPDPSDEVRLQLDACKVSIWMPAGATGMSAAMKALGEAGFDVARETSSADDVS